MPSSVALRFNAVALLLALLNTASIVVNALSSPKAIRRQPIGRITSLDRSKLDSTTDTKFYRNPNLVTHTDDTFIQRLEDVYREHLPSENGVILDIMSSHVSHLPSDVPLQRVDVHGMNAQELERNPARNATGGNLYVRDLNDNPSFVGLIDDNQEYDAVLCCVGVQYLEEPEAVFAEVGRILKPDTGVLIVSFTNRFFYQKALQGWIDRGMQERARLVQDYSRAAGGFDSVQVVGDGTSVWNQLASLGGFVGDPFVAVVAKRNNEP
ncbi:Methyltransferase [Seminavis robusta]|uniref:Methyltransferase n=1 Tax=Seminavis robusta TaxID=568900 RepID=A0A9N8DWR9_9STRA|nr:Methyltransferase [Seminavis robusta]|eukprot:Sro425_g140140.1 Methyltransferase (267) ;mRNA; r:29382-30182